MAGQVQITDGQIDANVEGSAHALQCSRAVHYRVEHSNGWISSHLFEDVEGDASVYFHIKSGSTRHFHGNFTVSSEAKATIEFFENPAFTEDGTALAENCLNRDSPATSDTTCFHTPTAITDDGTLLEVNILGADGKFCDIGGSLTDRGYWLLRKGEDYLVKVTNDDEAAKDICIACVWHEHASVESRHPPDKP